MFRIPNLNDVLVTDDVYQGETPTSAFIALRSTPDIVIRAPSVTLGMPPPREVKVEIRQFVDIGFLPALVMH